jgi:RNA polymerase sigma-70 factor (ECF subfamily)
MVIKALSNEKELLSRVSSGDERAFKEVFVAYYSPLSEYVLMLTKCSATTDEIIQDIFLKVWQNRTTLAGIEKFSAYLFILTKNYTLNALRKLLNDEKRKQKWTMDQDEVTVSLNLDDGFQCESNYEVVLRQAVESLPPQQRSVFTMRMQGHKNHEIALKMDISPDSVKKYQQYALSRIKKYVKSADYLDVVCIYFICNQFLDKNK